MPVAIAPKNKRLNDRDRTALYNFARRQIEATEDRSELDNAYEHAADAIHAAAVAKWPQKDMKVLERYDSAAPDPCIFISAGGSNYERFTFRPDDKRIALRPNRNGCNRIPLLLTGSAEAAFDAFKAASKARDEAVKKRLSDFSSLIFGTPSFNGLVEVWPAAETMREQIVGTATALSVLSSEVIDRLKADPALVAEAA